MKAEIISIGTELLLGEIADTNSSYIASQLPLLGIDLYWITVVGDNPARLRECLERALSRSDVVLTTGGLGPTQGDITRETIAAMLGEELRVNPALERNLREFFTKRNVPMPENNLKQAMLIPSAKSIPNPRGSAPGWWVEVQATPCLEIRERLCRSEALSPLGSRGLKSDARTLPHIIIAMPGPPAEMQRMWQSEVFAKLRDMVAGDIIVSKTLKTLTVAESVVAEKVAPLTTSKNPTLAIYARPDGIQLRLTAKAKSGDKAQTMIASLEKKVRALIGDIVWGNDEETLETIIGKLLSEKRLTLATMESCTGGLLASTITDVPGSSDYFKGGYVTYTNAAKIANGVNAELIERHGAVSPQVAADMARAARNGLSADIGIGVTGVAGPAEMEGKPAGTVFIAIDNGKKSKLIEGRYPPLRHQVKRRAVYHALFELRKLLLK